MAQDSKAAGHPGGGLSQPSFTQNGDLLQEWSVIPSFSSTPNCQRSLRTEVGSRQDSAKSAIETARSQSTSLDERSKNLHVTSRPLAPSKLPNISHARKTPPDHVKRPRNAFILFRSHTVAENLIPKEVEKDHRNISRIVSHMWKSLDDTERSKWKARALEEKEEHKKLYPDYKYKPSVRTSIVTRRNVKNPENGEEECQEIADVILKSQGREGLVLKPAKPRESTTKRARGETKARSRKAPRTHFASKAESLEAMSTVFLYSSTDNTSAKSPTSSTVDSDEEQADSMESSQMLCAASSVPPSPYMFMTSMTEPQVRAAVDSLLSADTDGSEASLINRQNLVQLTGELPDAEAGASNLPRIKPRPAPIFNTWHFGFCDDQALPASLPLARNECSDTIAPSSFRSTSAVKGFFNPWASDASNNPMLISPMRSTVKDLRRSSSLTCLQPDRRPSLGSIAAHVSEYKGPTNDSVTVNLFEEAARAAAANLEAELDEFSIDPSLQYEGFTHHFDDQTAFKHASNLTRELSYDRRWSPRLSFCGSTLAAAARDWTSRANRRETDAVVQVPESYCPEICAETCAPKESAMRTRQQDQNTAQIASFDTLMESVERAVTVVVQKLGNQLGCDDQGAALTREILASLGTQLLSGRSAPLPSSESCSAVTAQDSMYYAFRDDPHQPKEPGRKPSLTVDPRRRSTVIIDPRRSAVHD